MNKKEFTQRTGIELTDEQYEMVESMYYAATNIDKDEFCKDYKKHHGSVLMETYYQRGEIYHKANEVYQRQESAMVDFLLERAQVFGDGELLNKAIEMVGHSEVIKRKLEKGMPLWDIDREYVIENIR